MLLYDHIFHREMRSMTCQAGRPLPDWTKMCDVMHFMLVFFGRDCQDQFQKLFTAI